MTEHGSTHSTPACPVCGGPIPSDSPQGLCPKCLLAGAFGEGPDEMPAADATRPDADTGRRSVPPDIDRVRAAFS